jgi:hypothetical protein
MAGPHSAAALALIMQRFPYLTNEQALYTMFTTGRQNNTINDAAGVAVPNPMRGQMVQTQTGGTAGTRPTCVTPSRARASCSGRPTSTRRAIATCGRTTSPTSPSGRAGRKTPTKRPPGRRRRSPGAGPTAFLPTRATSTSRTSPSAPVASRLAKHACTRAASRNAASEPLTGNDTWRGASAVFGGKLSVVGSHASSVDVQGGTLGGGGTVAGDIDVAGGVLQPGVSAEEAASITDVAVAPGNVLHVGGDVSVAREGRVAVTIRSDDDYTSVQAAGDLVLDGRLTLDVQGALTPGTVLTIMRGKSIEGNFHAMPEKRVVNTGGYLFRVSYRNASVTLTVKHAVPARP